MATLIEFSRRMLRLGNSLEVRINNLKKATALTVDQTVVVATPVDTGRARSNWLVGIGFPERDADDPHDAGPFDKSGNASIAKAKAEISSVRPKDKTIYISNNLIYIGKLNRGSSAQAPRNYVRKAVIAAVARIRSLARGILS